MVKSIAYSAYILIIAWIIVSGVIKLQYSMKEFRFNDVNAG